MTLSMAVTSDCYELPIAIADNGSELAGMLGTTKGSIFSYISREKSGKSKRGAKAPYLMKKINIDWSEDDT